MVRFTFLTGDKNWLDYGAKWISQRFNNGDFNYWIVMELIVWAEAVGDREAEEIGETYHLSLCAAAPHEAGEENVARALDGCNIKDPTEEQQAGALADYGCHTTLWGKSGSNARKLMQAARQFVNKMDFNEQMNEPVNQVGTTGWEALKGDYDSGIRRAPGATGRIMRKISGFPEPAQSP